MNITRYWNDVPENLDEGADGQGKVLIKSCSIAKVVRKPNLKKTLQNLDVYENILNPRRRGGESKATGARVALVARITKAPGQLSGHPVGIER